MKNMYKLPFIFLLCVLVACNDDDDPSPANRNLDTESPKVYLLSPAANTTYLVINRVVFSANLSDNMGLGNARALLVDADGKRSAVTEPMPFFSNITHIKYGSSFYLRDVEPGTYTLVVEVEDSQKNMAKDSVTIMVHAPDINREAFAQAFENGNFFRQLDWGWFGFDFTKEVEFDEMQFTAGLYMMINSSTYIKENEWEQFVRDFRFEKQRWATWDENGDGELDGDEFHNGIKRLDLFKKWDTDNDKMVRTNEFVKGIFDRWDVNQDNRLTRAEYQEKFYKYLVFIKK
jgi:hypothetical protein